MIRFNLNYNLVLSLGSSADWFQYSICSYSRQQEYLLIFSYPITHKLFVHFSQPMIISEPYNSFLFKLLYTSVYAHVCVCACMPWCVCRDQNNLWELLLSFLCMGSRNWTQVVKFVSKHLISWTILLVMFVLFRARCTCFVLGLFLCVEIEKLYIT